MSAAAKEQKITYLDMTIEAIQALKDRKGASRMAIAQWVQEHHQKEAGSAFNAYLRAAIKRGLESGVLKEGQSAQRFRIGELPKAVKPKKKQTASSKKKSGSKKKGSSKKKTSSSKKGGSKKKTASNKKTGS